MPESNKPCRNCGAAMQGNYCQSCGQRAFVDSDRRLGHLLGQFFEALTDLDGRVWRSFRWLMIKPGALSREYLQGRRQRWLPPMSLFLLINVVYFIFQPVSDFNLSLNEQLNYQPWGTSAKPWVEEHAAARGQSLAEFADQYQQVSADVAKSLLIWHIPWLALGLMLLFYQRRMYYAEHFVVATHLISFVLALAVLLATLVSALTQLGLENYYRAIPQQWMIFVAFGLISACRSAYQASWLRTAIAVPLMVVAILLAHFSYRAAQFVVTLALT